MKALVSGSMVIGLGLMFLAMLQGAESKEEVIDLGEGVKLEMVLIPSGKFMMGSTKEAVKAALKGDFFFKESIKDKEEAEAIKIVEDQFELERQHEVTITKPFYMGKYEVTQEQWQRVMLTNKSKKKGAKLPVTNVSWDDCQEFIKKLNAVTKGEFRLPTEAEWEYACRAGTTTKYSFGDRISIEDANYDNNFHKEPGNQLIKPVGSYRSNVFGLYEMHGNVCEWCEDWYGKYPAGPVTDPKGSDSSRNRVLRGGSFYNSAWLSRSADRYYDLPDKRINTYGIRLARTIVAESGTKPLEIKPEVVIPEVELKGLLEAPFSEAKAKEVQQTIAKSIKREVEEKEDLGKGISLEMVLIPAGKFVMGSPKDEKGRFDSIEDQHEVTLTKPFYMGKYEVTQEQWEEVMGSNPSKVKSLKLPVTDVSWKDCQEFIKKLNEKTKGGFRLPTEAEWEYAGRAGTSTAYSFGDKITTKDANYDESRIGKPEAVGSYKANAFGLYDMQGNVWEWCEDWHGDYPKGPLTDPRGPNSGSCRVLRGGSFAYLARFTRLAGRNNNSPDYQSNYGFRLAWTP